MNALIIYINNLSSVPVELNLFDSAHNLLDPIAVSFRFVYIDRKKTRYEVEHRIANDTQSEYFKNCFIENGRLFIRFESTGFTTGRLERELWLTQELIPDKGEGFTNDEIKYILTETSAIEIISGIIPADCSQTNQYKKGSIIGIESIIFPCIEYTGTTSTQAEIIVNDFIHNKSLIAGAINAKGGEADKTDSAAKLADAILNLVPAQPIFQTSGSLNPRWTDLQAKIAENFRDDRQHAWAFSFLGDNQTVELTGGDYYICSDGYETDQSEAHTFGANLDENKTDNWVIIYTQTPVFVFPVTLFVLGAAFYNTSPELVKFYGTRIAFVSQSGGDDNDVMTLPPNFLRNTKVSYYTVPDNILELIAGTYSFAGTPLLDFDLNGVKKITVNAYAFQGVSLYELELGKNVLDTLVLAADSLRSITAQSLRLRSKSVQVSGAACFSGSVIDEVTVDCDTFTMASSNYMFNGSTVKRINILAKNSLTIHQYFISGVSGLEEIYIQNPLISLSFAMLYGGTAPYFTLGEGWNWSINISNISGMATDSMYRNVQALADRTGQTALTLTFGSAKLNALLTAHPDAATIASSKNWNLA